MLKNSLIIIPCNVPWDWSTDYMNQTAKVLGKTNDVLTIFWLEAPSLKEITLNPRKREFLFRKLGKRITAYYFLHILPFKRFTFIYRVNITLNIIILFLYIFLQQYIKRYTRKILWFFDPRTDEITSYFPVSWFRIYDCVDYYRGDVNLSEKSRNDFIKREHEVIRSSDIVTVNSHILYKLFSPLRPDIQIVPQGFRLDTFTRPKRNAIVIPHDLPVVGYIGALNYRLDYRLMVGVARRLPTVRFVFVGPIQEEDTTIGQECLQYAKERLFSLPNVLRIPPIGKEEIPGIISQFDIGMIPYDWKQDFNRYCYPMKLFEYFYMGKPVISTPIEELKRFPKFVKIGKTPLEWKRHVYVLYGGHWPSKYRHEQRTFAKKNRWEKKINHIMNNSKFLYQ